MTHFPTISYTLISEIPTLSYGPKAWKSNPLSWRSLPVQVIIGSTPCRDLKSFQFYMTLICFISVCHLYPVYLTGSSGNLDEMISNKRNNVCGLMCFSSGRRLVVWLVFGGVSLTERLQTGAVSLQKPTIVWLFQDLGKLPSQLAKHQFNHKDAVILACVESVSNRVIELFLLYSFFVLLSSQLSWRTRAETLATQATGSVHTFSFFQQKRKQEILLIVVIFTYFKVQTKIEKKKMVRKIDHFFIFLILKSASKIQKIL